MNTLPPSLNWRELAALIELYRPIIEGTFIDRVFIPERLKSPEGYLRDEWAFRLNTGRVFLVSVRVRQPYFALLPQGSSLSNAAYATQSAFGMALSKHLRGAKIEKLEMVERERVLLLWTAELGLALSLIPAAPEGFVVTRTPGSSSVASAPVEWQVLARSRANLGNTEAADRWSPPSGASAPTDLKLREELVRDYASTVERTLEAQAFEVRLGVAEKALKERLKQARFRLKHNETAAREASREANWKKLGDLLKAHLGKPPALIGGVRRVLDYETDTEIDVPCDAKLEPKAQVEKFYSMAKRKARREEEALSRVEAFTTTAAKAEQALAAKPETLDWKALEAFELAAGVQGVRDPSTPLQVKKETKRKAAWLGRSFVSRDGLAIWVGKSRDENLELTFKHARGNDLWMHVRGKPGAHVVVPLTSNKSAPLETLLDAAHLCIFYSGGENWGKSEVDYTFKKYVKRIKDSTEASYTHNKTLIVELDSARMKRLLGTDG